MNNEGIINYNSNQNKITDLKYDIIPGKIYSNSNSNTNNKDNNLSKSHNKDKSQSILNYNENYSKDYYAPSPASQENYNIINNNFIQNNNNNNNILIFLPKLKMNLK